jgi:hypothetical protein
VGRAAEIGRREQKRAILEALRARLLERNYINNLLAIIDREKVDSGSSALSGLAASLRRAFEPPRTEWRLSR